jgi:hypothetical protein
MNTGVGIRTVALPNPPLASPLEMPLKKLTTPTTNSETPSTKILIVIARSMLKPPKMAIPANVRKGSSRPGPPMASQTV